MKKNTGLFLFFIFSYMGLNAQYKYKVEYDLTLIGEACSAYNHLTLTLNPNSDNEIIYDKYVFIYQQGSREISTIYDNVITLNNLLTAMNINASRNPNNYQGCSNPYNTPNSCSRNIDLVPYDINNGFSLYSFQCPTVRTNHFRVYRIKNFLDLNASQNYELKECESIRLVAFGSYAHQISYSVDYSIGNGSWAELLPYGTREPSFELAYDDIQGVRLGQNVRIKVNYTPTKSHSSNIISYRVIPCPPGLNSIRPINPLCSGDNRGGFIASFDRDLNEGETLYLFLHNNNDNIQVANLSTTTLGLNNTYMWSGSLEPGNYRLEYQTSTSDGRSSLVSDEFPIRSPHPIEFSAIQTTNILCYGEDNGAINITITGGSPNYYSPSYPYYSYSLNNSDYSNTLSGLTIDNLIAGDYTLRVRDRNGCVADTVITISEPPPIRFSNIQKTNILCYGGNNGSIDNVVVAGGTPVYSYSWTNSNGYEFSRSLNISNLTLRAGDYTLTVRDANGCEADTVITIEQPEILRLIAYSMAVSEYGGNDGYINLSVSGGTAPYTWRKAGTTGLYSTNQNINNLTAGYHDLIVRDKNGCSLATSILITEPEELLVTISEVNSIICPSGTGSLTANPSGGVTPYQYKWYRVNGGTSTLLSSTSQTISNLSAGTYKVEVTDNNDIPRESANFNLTQPPAITLTETIQHPSVNGGNNGSIDISVTGGTAPYSYEWRKAGTDGVYSENPNINSLTAGVYTVTIKDKNYASTTSNTGCELVQSFTVTEPERLSVSIIKSQEITCFNASDGILMANPRGGVSGTSYRYQWYKVNNGTDNLLSETSQTISDLSAGVYKVEVTDDNNISRESGNYNLNEPPSLTFSSSQTDILCYGEDNGAINITVTGGSGSYTYEWRKDGTNNNVFSRNPNINTLRAGKYYLSVTDANGCKTNNHGTGITIAQPERLTLTIENIQHLSVNGGNNGSIDISVSGGTSSYTYEWTDAQNTTVGNSEDIRDIGAGSYTLTVKDGNFNSISSDTGCTISETIVLTEPDLLAVTITVTNAISCFGDSNGALQANATGGISPYSYEWFKVDTSGISTTLGISTETITHLATGLYRIRITDAHNISIVTDFNLESPDVLRVDNISVTNVLCFNDTTGSIDITVVGGTAPYTYFWNNNAATGGTAPYTYFWSNGATTQDISSLSSGTYNVVITDVNNCEITQNRIIISQPTKALSIDSSIITSLTGFGTNDGVIKVLVSGGTPSYSYSWVETGTTNVLSTVDSISNLAVGNYQVTITDSTLCQLTQTYEVTQPDELLVEIEQTLFNLCFNDSAATIQANATGGVLPYTYSWHNLNDQTNILGTSMNFENIMAGSYGITITDANGIETSDTITINHPNELNLNVTVNNILCYGEQTGAIDITVSGGTGTYSYQWSNRATTEDINGLNFGNYIITITDANNCSISEIFSITQPNVPLQISNTQIIEPLGFGLSNGSIAITIEEGTPNYTYAWFDSLNTQLTDTTAILNNIPAGNYAVIVTDANNCTVEQQFSVEQPPILEVSITNVPINCNGETGTLTASASGGSLLNGESYTYQWYDTNNNPLVDTASLSNISVGNYSVIVTDHNGIEVQSNFNLTEPTLLEITHISKTDVLCYGEQTGVIDITVAGGTGTYTYSWSNGVRTEDINGLSAGDYTITITDENNCSVSDTYSIIQPVLYDISNVSLIRPTGSNADGSITIDVTGGKVPFTYQWFDSLGTLVQTTVNSTLNTNILNNVEPKRYTIVITDSTGCIHEDTYTLGNPGELITHIEEIQVISCNGGSDGQLMAHSVGGSGGNQYAWYNVDTNAIVGRDNVLNVSAGSYYVVVSNVDGLQEQSSVLTITEPAAVQVTSTSQNLSCYQGEDGFISLQATGGTEVFEYRIRLNSNLYSNWLPFTDDSIEIENLISGNYKLQVRDTNQCNFEINGTQTIEITITQPNLLAIVSNTTNDVTGFNLSNGSIALAINGGTQPYTYVWTDSSNITQSSTSEVLSNITSGTYLVNIADTQGCTTSGIYTVNQPDLLEVTVDTQNIILCNGDQNGSLRASVTGGVPFTTGNSYLYNWFEQGNPTPIGTNITLEDLGRGNYFVIVEDQNRNTTQSDILELTEPEILTAVLDGDYMNCGTANDWTISTQVLGGTSPYSYIWNTGDNTSEIVNVQAGNYLVIITDSYGCEIIKNYNVAVPEALNVEANITQINCADACEGEIALNITGGIAPYIINWETGDTTTAINNLCSGTYIASITDQLGCEVVLDLTIENPEAITLDLGEDRTLCNEQSHELDIAINDVNASYNWTSNNGFSSNLSNVSLTEAGIYTATLTTALGCVGTDSIEIFQSQTGINSKFLITTQAFATEDIILVNTSNPPSINIQWFIPNEAEIIQQNNETITLRFDIPGAYEITLRTFQGNCYQDYPKPIIVEEARDLLDIGDANTPFIIDFIIFPNPTTGVFEVDIRLQEEATVSLRLFSLVSSVTLDDRQVHNASEYHINYSMDLSTGIYFFLLETAKGSEIRKIIIE